MLGAAEPSWLGAGSSPAALGASAELSSAPGDESAAAALPADDGASWERNPPKNPLRGR